MQSVVVKRGDKHATRWVAVGVDLTGSTVRLLAKLENSPTIELEAMISDPENGVVEHVLTGDLDPGVYRVELEITKGDTVMTAPSDSYASLTVLPDLG